MASKSKHTQALTEKDGIEQPKRLSDLAAKNVIKSRKKTPSVAQLLKGISEGDKSSLSRSITLIESTNLKHQEHAKMLIEACLQKTSQSVRIGITGVPGVGKSTFIEQFGKLLVSEGKKVAILAVDPSSSLSKGSILGDKTRMESLVLEPLAFIRPSPSGDSLGGVARKTREAIILCEAAGYNHIIIETVGVGQSETAVHSMTDFFLLLKLAGAGDELQGIKRGIIEMADAIAINKADGENVKAAKLAKTAFNSALHLYPPKPSGWIPKTTICSAFYNEGIDDVWTLIKEYISETTKSGHLPQKRKDQNKFWLKQTIESRLKDSFYNNAAVKKALKEQMVLLDENKTTAFAAAEVILKQQ